MDSGREKINSGAEQPNEEYTLESILAEYKGNAFIQGEKRLSRDELEKQVQSIFSEYSGGAQNDATPEYIPVTKPRTKPPEPASDVRPVKIHEPKTAAAKKSAAARPLPQQNNLPVTANDDDEVKEYIPRKKAAELNSRKPPPKKSPNADETQVITTPKKPRTGEIIKAETRKEPEKVKKGDYRAEKKYEKKRAELEKQEFQRQIILEREEAREKLEAQYDSMSDDEQRFFGVGKYARADAVEKERGHVDAAVEREAERRRRQNERRQSKKTNTDSSENTESARLFDYEELEISPDDAITLYGNGIVSLSRRIILAFILCAAMTWFAFSAEFNLPIPALFSDIRTFSLFLLILELVLLLVGVDVFLSGLAGIFTLRFGGEALTALSCIVSAADALTTVLSDGQDRFQPYIPVAAFSLFFTMWGVKLGKKAYNRTFRNIMATKSPITVTAEWEKADEGLVLTKRRGELKGFVTKSTESDLCEQVYARLAPLLVIASVLFALLSSIFKGESGIFLHAFSAMTAVSASFSSLLAFNLPFSSIARRLTGAGAAIAGWSGVCDIKDAIGMVVRDLDLFPENTVSLNGVKVFPGHKREKVVSYTGTLILASGSGLSHIFAAVLKEYACGIQKVEDFACYEGGGIGASVEGCNVLVGSAAFMNLMGIRLASNLNIKSAVFTAINGELAGVFIINYLPVDSVQSALVTLIRSKITPLFAVRDFNVTPAMVKNKFKISTDEIEFMTFETRYKLSSAPESTEIKPSAIMSREGLGHFVEVVRCGRQLISTVKASVAVSAFSAVLGLLITFFICYTGAYASVSAQNVLIYMILTLLPVLVLNSAGTRF